MIVFPATTKTNNVGTSEYLGLETQAFKLKDVLRVCFKLPVVHCFVILENMASESVRGHTVILSKEGLSQHQFMAGLKVMKGEVHS